MAVEANIVGMRREDNMFSVEIAIANFDQDVIRVTIKVVTTDFNAATREARAHLHRLATELVKAAQDMDTN